MAPAGGTPRACVATTDNGFGLTYNWNLLGDGEHTVRALADGVEFANVTVTVTTLGAAFLEDIDRNVPVHDFPDVGTKVVLRWQEAQQNFVITGQYPSRETEQWCLSELTNSNYEETFNFCLYDFNRHELNDAGEGEDCDFASDAPYRRNHYPLTCEGAVQFYNDCEALYHYEF